ncbi:serine protease [Chlorogloea sp. CCALA 695]|uniref:serine protease n=1 Tax=Chlorogloea sp. CCALA 695 TaxID=2107693 RepID=UPI000D066B95|nr:serine protease [Chlorogloea sp. CCALA 695]PSB26669.1 hypothetical protein C7B70_23565 [Chlorogloea sp. CCALA 695]
MNLRHLGIIPLLGSLLILPITAVALTNPISANPDSIQLARSLSPTQIRQLAQAITVKVLTNRELGSGILIAKQGTNYTVLTNAHVLNAKGNYRLQTPDGIIYSALVINKGNSLQGNDLAILQFSSPKNYRIVTLATTTTKAENQSVYAAGFSIDSQQLLITTGKISLIAPKPLAGGYQLGYTNQIKQGMSGGPLLNQSGELIGVNGLLNNAILNDTYTYLDGSSPTNEVRQQLRQLSFAVPIATLAQLPTQEAVIPSQERNQNPQPVPVPKQSALTGVAGEVDLIAQQITLRIDSKNNGNGSGVIIARQGQIYYVLTASHVVENQDQYTVLTPDGETHPVAANDIVKEAGLDVAILKFSSQKEYPVATLARYNLSDSKSHWVFLSGFPGSQKGHRKFSPGVRFDKNDGFFQTKDTTANLSNGYELVFTNLSLPGMSGGPLLDVKGRVIGIGGRSEGEEFSEKLERNLGYALGVPITTGLALATKAGLKPQWMKVETSSSPTLTDAEVSSIRNQPSFTPTKPEIEGDENEWLNYGNLLWRLERYDEAVAALQQSIAKNPDFYQAYYALGLIQQFQRKFPEAVATFKQVIGINPDYYQAWREQSSTLVWLKKYSQALAAIEQAIKINAEQADKDNNPQDFILYVNKGNVLYELKRYAEAEAALNEAINIKPSELTYNNRGSVRYIQKNYPGAGADYNQAIRINPQLAEAYYNRGNLYTEQKNYPGAEADYNQAIRINPQLADAYNNRGLLRKEQKNYPGAEADYNQAITINPEDADAYLNRGVLRKEQKNYPGAEADYNQAIRINPEDALAYNNRGILRKEQKNYPGAEADYNQAIRINPEDALAYGLRGIVRKEQKNYPGAEADYNQAIRINPEDALAYNNRGNLRKEQKNYPSAIADLQTAAQLFRQQGNPKAYQQVQ